MAASSTFWSWTITRASSARSRSGDASKGLMSISLIPRCSTTRWLNRTRSCSSAAQVHRRAAAHALERGEDLGLLHHPPGQRGIERRQAQCAILDDFDELAARAEKKYRAELGVEAAADDQLVTVERDHRLNAHPLEMLGTGVPADRRLDGAIGTCGPPRHR